MVFPAAATALLLAGALVGPGVAQARPQLVGGGPDSHGCYADGGYAYSVVRRTCIRIWEAGIRLDPVKPQGSAVMSAFVVFASEDDRREAELFIPGVAAPPVLRKIRHQGVRTWSGNGYTLTLHDGIYSLADTQGEVIFRGSPSGGGAN